MANRQRAYQWINGVVQVVDLPRGALLESELWPKTRKRDKPPAIGLQNWLLVFTLSSVLMVFAGLGLFAFYLVIYSLIFG